MTVAEKLKEWISQYGAQLELETDFIEAGNGSYSFYKSPQSNIVTHIDGSKLITEYYNFFMRQSTQMDEERIENQEWLARFEEWIDEQNFEENYPDLAELNSECQEIAVTGSATITSQEDDSAIYQVTISIQYLKERKNNGKEA